MADLLFQEWKVLLGVTIQREREAWELHRKTLIARLTDHAHEEIDYPHRKDRHRAK